MFHIISRFVQDQVSKNDVFANSQSKMLIQWLSIDFLKISIFASLRLFRKFQIRNFCRIKIQSKQIL